MLSNGETQRRSAAHQRREDGVHDGDVLRGDVRAAGQHQDARLGRLPLACRRPNRRRGRRRRRALELVDEAQRARQRACQRAPIALGRAACRRRRCKPALLRGKVPKQPKTHSKKHMLSFLFKLPNKSTRYIDPRLACPCLRWRVIK